MKLKQFITTTALAMGMVTTPVISHAAAQFSDAQKKDIQQIIHQYIVNNPEILVEASKALQSKQQKEMVSQAKTAIESNHSEIFGDQSSPVVGNPNGNVTLVEFFDYQCIHCKQMAAVVEGLVKKDKNLKVIYKQFPIFGKGSEFAAKAALASQKQDKYAAFHEALMSAKKRLSPTVVIDIAKSVGLNTKQLTSDMKNGDVDSELKSNLKLAERLRLMGTPAFIIASTPNGKYQKGAKSFFVPGAASEQSLQSLINQANS